MANLISGGLSYALMSADSSAKAALKPMNMVSRELRKQAPDWELVERAGKYGGQELNRADEALTKAREELKESQRAARQEEKAEQEKRLKEKAEEKRVDETNAQTAENAETSISNKVVSGRENFDIVEISATTTSKKETEDISKNFILDKGYSAEVLLGNIVSKVKIDLKA